MRTANALLLSLGILVATHGEPTKPATSPAKVIMTGEFAGLTSIFSSKGVAGAGGAAKVQNETLQILSLKLDEQTKVRVILSKEVQAMLLGADAAGDINKASLKAFEFNGKSIVVEGNLSLAEKDENKYLKELKGLVLVADKALLLPEKDADKYPAKGLAYVRGPAICGHCDLGVCDDCTLAVKNTTPIILDGDLARDHAEGKGDLSVTGKLFVDKAGLLRLKATKVVEMKPAKEDKKP